MSDENDPLIEFIRELGNDDDIEVTDEKLREFFHGALSYLRASAHERGYQFGIFVVGRYNTDDQSEDGTIDIIHTFGRDEREYALGIIGAAVEYLHDGYESGYEDLEDDGEG